MSHAVPVPVEGTLPVAQAGGGTSMFRKLLWVALGALALYFVYTRFLKKKEPELGPDMGGMPMGPGGPGPQPTPEQMEHMAIMEQQYQQQMMAAQAQQQAEAHAAQQAAMEQQAGQQGPPPQMQQAPPQGAPQQAMPPRPNVQ